MSSIQEQLDYAEAVAGWLIELGGQSVRQGALEDALKYTHLAATVLCRQNRTLSSARLEANLQAVAARLPLAEACADAGTKPERPAACLHVLSEALPAGGLTAMATRWMMNDGQNRRHHVALLAQRAAVPESLVAATRRTGGEVHVVSPDDSLLARALWLRQRARELAGHVVLHVDVSDVIAGAAFGVAGGPPVMLVNHTAHLYWNGAGIVDAVLNCRGSALEGVWAERYRGVPRHASVPIPLETPESESAAESRASVRQRTREQLGIAADAVVLLTVGAAFKYLAVGELDFVRTCKRVLTAVPDAVVLAVGFPADERWRAAAARVGGRIRTPGRLSQTELAAVHAASDIYIEGFPFGTTTSLLESALRGLPVVLAPAVCPPPFGSDGVALDEVLARPDSVADYERFILELIHNPAERERQGQIIRASVAQHHSGAGWQAHLQAALAALPGEHQLPALPAPAATPAAIHEYWFRFQSLWTVGAQETLENVLVHACSLGLRPRLTPGLVQACRAAATVRRHRTIPLPLLRGLCGLVLPLLPARAGGRVIRLTAFLFRGGLLARVGRRVRQVFHGAPSAPSAYGEYRGAARQARGGQP